MVVGSFVTGAAPGKNEKGSNMTMLAASVVLRRQGRTCVRAKCIWTGAWEGSAVHEQLSIAATSYIEESGWWKKRFCEEPRCK